MLTSKAPHEQGQSSTDLQRCTRHITQTQTVYQKKYDRIRYTRLLTAWPDPEGVNQAYWLKIRKMKKGAELIYIFFPRWQNLLRFRKMTGGGGGREARGSGLMDAVGTYVSALNANTGIQKQRTEMSGVSDASRMSQGVRLQTRRGPPGPPAPPALPATARGLVPREGIYRSLIAVVNGTLRQT